MRRNGLAGLATGMTLTMLLAACGSTSGGATAAPSAAPTPEPTAPTAPLGLFTGHDVCRDGDPEGAADTGAVVCDRVVTDARLTGKMESSAQGGLGSDPDLFIEWRTFTMTNGGGAWTCQQLLIGEGESAGWADQVCFGRDGYAGLAAYVHAMSGNATSDFGVLGWVEEMP